MKLSNEIRIIGAGPAGLTAAINLAANNHKVTVFEKNSDVGMRFHNDFQGIENWSTEKDVIDDLRSMSVTIDFLCKPFFAGMFKGPTTSGKVTSEKPLFYLVKRGTDPDSLDQTLKKQALDKGVRIVFNASEPTDSADIIATGPKSPRMIAAGIVFNTNIQDTAFMVLDNAIAPKGYAYLLASDKRASLATVLFEHFSEAGHYLDKAILKFKESIAFEIRDPQKFAGYGNFSLMDSAIQNGKKYIGEAAGFQDFLFGFGIRYAMTSGYLAGKSIIENKDYNHLWKVSFSRQLQTSLSNRTYYELFGNRLYDYLVEGTKRSKNPRMLWNKFYNASLSRKLMFPLTLCRLGRKIKTEK